LNRKLTVIGAGSVGATIAYTLSTEHIATDIIMIDIDEKKAEGEVMDIMQGTSFRDPINIVAGDFEDARDSDIVIIACGVARQKGQTRLELAQVNVDIIKDITPKITAVAPNALYIIVSNPVDVVTYAFLKLSGLPENQVIGSGTILDTSRLRVALSDYFNIAQKNIHAYVFGEHGDSAFIPWSLAQVSGVNLDEYVALRKDIDPEITDIDKDGVTEFIHKSGSQVIANKGATYYAVSASVCRLCDMLFSAYNSIVTVSTPMHGDYGIDDVCLSTLTLVGPNGAQGKVPVKLSDEEIEKLRLSAAKLRETIENINI